MQEKLKFNVIELTDGRIIFNNSVQKLGEVPETLIFNNRKELADYINPQVTTLASSAEDSHSKSKVWINEIDKAYGDHPKMNINALHAQTSSNAFKANDYYPHNLPKRCNDGTVFKSKEDSKPPVKPEIAAMAEFAVKCGYGGRFKEFSLALAGIGYLADECLKEQANPQDGKE